MQLLYAFINGKSPHSAMGVASLIKWTQKARLKGGTLTSLTADTARISTLSINIFEVIVNVTKNKFSMEKQLKIFLFMIEYISIFYKFRL